METAQVFNALGDPTRLEIVRRLSTGALHTITTVAEGLAMSRQGVRKHLQVLAKARLVSLNPKGRDVQIQLEKQTLEQAKVFIAQIERQWDARLAALKDFAERE